MSAMVPPGQLRLRPRRRPRQIHWRAPLSRGTDGSAAGPRGRLSASEAAGGAVMPAGGTAVGQDLVNRVAARDPGDPSAAVCRGTGLVQATDRRAEVRVAGRGTGVEHLAQAQFAMEDVAADEPVFLLHLVRPDD